MNIRFEIPRHWQGFKVLGKGSFSSVYTAFDALQGVPIAVKIPNDEISGKLLEKESEILRLLKSCKSKFHSGIPQILDFSQPRSFITMQKVGKTLLGLQTELKQFSLKSVLMIAVGAISALEELHSCGFVHRDIKPDNIAVALRGSDPRIYLIDMGLGYRYELNGTQVAYSENNEFQGTPHFCSINSLRGIKSTRRDDLEALGYVLVFLCSGSLPWLNERDLDSLEDILSFREKFSTHSLCSKLDREFEVYLTKCQNYGFSEKPNYQELRDLFTTLAAKKDIQLDWKYDWFPRLKQLRFKASSNSTQGLNVSEKSKSIKRPSIRVKMLELKTHMPHPSHVGRRSMRRASESMAWGLEETPVHRVDQLPSFSRRQEIVMKRRDSCGEFL